jgi:hypothetical protein
MEAESLHARGGGGEDQPGVAGDSIFEREAAHFVGRRHENVAATKTIKFIQMPTLAQLRQQIGTVIWMLPRFCDVEKSFDVDMEF